MKKASALLIILCCVLLLTGCVREKIHTRRDICLHVNGLSGGPYGDETWYRLRGHYDVIGDETAYDKDGREMRTLTFQVKGTDLTFHVTSSYRMVPIRDGTSYGYSYALTDDYREQAASYFIQEYNRSIGYDGALNDKGEDGSIKFYSFKIDEYRNIAFVLDYISGFFDYCNSLDVRFFRSSWDSFYLLFPEGNEQHLFPPCYAVKAALEDNFYTFQLPTDDPALLILPPIPLIEQDIQVYLDRNDICLP